MNQLAGGATAVAVGTYVRPLLKVSIVVHIS